MLLRWIVAAIFGLLWLLVVVVNVQLLWKYKGSEYRPSPVTMLGFLFALAAIGFAPSKNALKWLLLIPAAILDIGTGPIILLEVAIATREAFQAAQKRVARASRILKYGGGFLVWWIILGGVLGETGILQWVLGFIALAYWPLLLFWFRRAGKIRV
jgi:hypothetical protein